MDRHVMFDTNALLDAVEDYRPQHDEAQKAILNCNYGGDMGIMCGLSLKDAYYILTKKYSEAHARQAVRWLMELLVIGPISAEECEMAAFSDEPDFEDGLIRACAELNDVDYIITRDKAAYANSKIKAMTASEYLERFEEDERELRRQLGGAAAKG